MATETPSRPGVQVGPTSEFSLFFRVRPGHGAALREALEALQDTPGYRPGDYEMAIATIHEARFVLFDDDTRLLFATSFDGPWDAYMEDLRVGADLQLFDAIFRHVEGYDGLPDLAAVKAFILGAQETAGGYARNYGGTVKEIRKAQRVNDGVPAGARRPGRRGGAAAPGAAAAARRGRGLTRPRPTDQRTPMSDHISGPRALADPIADITDVYAFPSPERPGHLVLVHEHAAVRASRPTAFSDGLIYRFRLRPLTAAAPDGSGAVRRRAARSSSSTASSPTPTADGDGPRAGGHLHHARGRDGPFRVERRAGRLRARASASSPASRWDPFIMDAPAALKTIATGQLAFTDPGAIYLDGKNVLSLVVEIDCALLLGGAELVGVVAETLTRGRFNVRIERVGRPEVKNMMLAPEAVRPGQPRPRDPRPVQHGGRVPPRRRLPGRVPGPAERQPRVLGRPRRQDRLAARTRTATHPLTELVLADYLVVDVTKPYAEQGSFLEIELAARRGEPHRTCGGRALNDDVMDTLFTQLINAGNGPVIRDGVDQATQAGLARRSPTSRRRIPTRPQLPEHH